MLTLGLRWERRSAKWEDVDLDKSTVFVRRALQRVVKEDGSTELQLVEPKSDRSYRLVSIPASIVAFLARHRARQNRERLVAGSRWQQTGHTFASTIGTPLDERNVRREFYDLLKAQNLPRMRPHDLRHSYARFCSPPVSIRRSSRKSLGIPRSSSLSIRTATCCQISC